MINIDQTKFDISIIWLVYKRSHYSYGCYPDKYYILTKTTYYRCDIKTYLNRKIHTGRWA